VTKISGKFLNARIAAERVKGRRPGIITQKTQVFDFKESINFLPCKLNTLFIFVLFAFFAAKTPAPLWLCDSVVKLFRC
jgi:hypothetical protein